MKTQTFRQLLVAAVVLSCSAFAQTNLSEVKTNDTIEPHGASWESSVLTGRTVGAGRFVVHPEIGYPGVRVGLLWGQSSTFDVGARLSVGYGSRWGFGFAPGLGAQGVMRWNFVNQGILSLGARFEPGIFLAPYDRGNVMLLAPFGLDLGIHPHPIVNVALGLDVGVGAVFDYQGRSALVLPVGFGPGVEVNLTDALALTLDTRFGGGWSAPFYGPYTGYGFRAAIGLAIRN